METTRTCQFSPSNLDSSFSSIFSLILPLSISSVTLNKNSNKCYRGRTSQALTYTVHSPSVYPATTNPGFCTLSPTPGQCPGADAEPIGLEDSESDFEATIPSIRNKSLSSVGQRIVPCHFHDPCLAAVSEGRPHLIHRPHAAHLSRLPRALRRPVHVVGHFVLVA
jgi:hypothetical protein